MKTPPEAKFFEKMKKNNSQYLPHGTLFFNLSIFNAACPYLGLKTKCTFSMFSNLELTTAL